MKMLSYICVCLLSFLLGGCTVNGKKSQTCIPFDGKPIAVMPIEGSHGGYGTTVLIAALESRGIDVISDKVVRETANSLGIKKEHRIFPEGPSVYTHESQLAIAKALGVAAYFKGKNETTEISYNTFSKAKLDIAFVQTATEEVLWSDTYESGIFSLAITAKQHVRRATCGFASKFAKYKKPVKSGR